MLVATVILIVFTRTIAAPVGLGTENKNKVEVEVEAAEAEAEASTQTEDSHEEGIRSIHGDQRRLLPREVEPARTVHTIVRRVGRLRRSVPDRDPIPTLVV